MEDVIESIPIANSTGIERTTEPICYSPVPETEPEDESQLSDRNSSDISTSSASTCDTRPVTELPVFVDVLNRDNATVCYL